MPMHRLPAVEGERCIGFFFILFVVMSYKNLFFDLDDTLWDFAGNARESFVEAYKQFDYQRFFPDFESFYDLYQGRNQALWKQYGAGEIDKQTLNELRFLYPLQEVGVEDVDLARRFGEEVLRRIPHHSGLMPHAREMLDYLAPRYRLFILSNGFREQQACKLKLSGIDGYFRKVVLSEDLGVLKPRPEIFHFACSATQSLLQESLMIGDSWENDIEGAKGAGMDQVFYNVHGKTDLPFRPTFCISSLAELMKLL